jgi:hypothetical protein
VFFASNDGGPLGLSGINQNNGIFKLNLTEAERMLGSAQGGNQTVNVPITQVELFFFLVFYIVSELSSLFHRSRCRIVYK